MHTIHIDYLSYYVNILCVIQLVSIKLSSLHSIAETFKISKFSMKLSHFSVCHKIGFFTFPWHSCFGLIIICGITWWKLLVLIFHMNDTTRQKSINILFLLLTKSQGLWLKLFATSWIFKVNFIRITLECLIRYSQVSLECRYCIIQNIMRLSRTYGNFGLKINRFEFASF